MKYDSSEKVYNKEKVEFLSDGSVLINSKFALTAMSKIPCGYVDKTSCGCGLTTVALENNNNTIIAMPTVVLVGSKSYQYSTEGKEYSDRKMPNHEVLGVFGKIDKDDIDIYVGKCIRNNWPIKIAVTYDSLWKVEYLLNKCDFVIDEADRILGDAHLKASNKLEIGQLTATDKLMEIAYKYRDKVSFISATPTDVKYMDDWIEKLHQVKMRWKYSKKIKPFTFKTNNTFKSLKQAIILPIKNLGYAETNCGIRFSKAIIFINSVSKITRACRECELDPKDVGIICSDNFLNETKNGIYSRLHKDNYGNLPKYTFITSTGFQGIDLNSNSAMAVVVSNANSNDVCAYQMVDMKESLKQAMSRQRNYGNPNYGKCIFIYNDCIFEKTENEIMDIIKSRRSFIGNHLKTIEELLLKDVSRAADQIKLMNTNIDCKTYITVKDGNYILNEKLFNSDKINIIQTRRQFSEGFNIQNAIDGTTTPIKMNIYKEATYRESIQFFNQNNINGDVDWSKLNSPTVYCDLIEKSYKYFGKTFKTVKNATEMIATKDNKYEHGIIIAKELVSNNEEYKMKEAKAIVSKVYAQLNLKSTPKAKYLLDMIKGSKIVQVKGTKIIRMPEKIN